jgi:hypothetical protein
MLSLDDGITRRSETARIFLRDLEPRAGFEPATPALPSEPQARELFAFGAISEEFWEDFNVFLCNEYTRKYTVNYFRYAKKYHQCLRTRDFSLLKMMSSDKRLHVMKALSALAKFVGIYEDFKGLVKSFGLKWTQNTDDLIIARLCRAGNGYSNELVEWVKAVKQKFPEFALFMDFVTATGLRFEEAVSAYNLIVEKSEKEKLGEYYNAEKQMLEHFRFKERFIRRTKKAFISFVSPSLVEAITTKGQALTLDMIQKKIARSGMHRRFGDVREFYANYSIRLLRQPEIDFVQGRISASVFMHNYFNPTVIVDLQERALKNISELLSAISIDS